MNLHKISNLEKKNPDPGPDGHGTGTGPDGHGTGIGNKATLLKIKRKALTLPAAL